MTLVFSFVVTTPHHHFLGSKRGMGAAGRMLTIMVFSLATQTAPTFILHVSLQVYKRARLDVHDIILASGRALGYEVSVPNVYCSGTGKRISRIRSSRTYGLFAPSHQRSGNGHEYFQALTNRGALSIS